MATQDCILELRDHATIVSEDAGKHFLSTPETEKKVATHLILDRFWSRPLVVAGALEGAQCLYISRNIVFVHGVNLVLEEPIGAH